MGSKKHKKHKSERRERYEEFSTDQRPSSLKLILKVGNNSTPEYGNDSPAYGILSDGGAAGPSAAATAAADSPFIFSCDTEDYPEKPKKSKKKKKKKDREKKHKHHKEKRHRHRDDSSQDEISLIDDSSQPLPENVAHCSTMSTCNAPNGRPMSKPIIPMKVDVEMLSPASSPTKNIPDNMQIIIPSPGTASTPGTTNTGNSTPGPVFTPKVIEAPKTPSSSSESGREPRSCVLKLKQSKSPLIKLLDHLLRSLEKRDPHQFFAWPVTDDIAPGYSSIIPKPMDFSTMRQKIEDNEYGTLIEFAEDFKLMCDNAIRYNHVETVYHKAAKKLLHVGMKLLQPESLMRSLKPMSGYMRELTAKELGFELLHGDFNDHHIIDSADEGASTGADEPTQAQLEEEEKRRAIRLENNPKTRFEPYVDDLTSEEILAQVETAARAAKKRISNKKNAHSMGFLRQNRDGTTSLKILLKQENEGPEKVVTIGNLVGKLKHGTGQIQGLREDSRNRAKTVKSLSYGAFSSFAPVFDSRFSNLSKEDTDLVIRTYGDAACAEYAESILQFTKDSSYANVLADGLLDVLTQGEHNKTISALYDSQCQKFEQTELEKRFPDVKAYDDEQYEKYKNTRIDFNKLKSLSELGIDTTFLAEMEKDVKLFEITRRLSEHLNNNLPLLDKLQTTQHDRLSQPLPNHLAQVPQPGADEMQLAQTISQNLTDIAKQLPPSVAADPHGLRKAMGISNVGLEPHPPNRLIIPTILQEACNQLTVPNSVVVQQHSANTVSVAMDIDEDVTNSNPVHTTVDLESELLEFLENGSALAGPHTHDDSTAIEQMLLN